MSEGAIAIQPEELAGLRSSMRDVQVSVSEFSRHTIGFGIGPEELATPARSAVSFIQALNDILTNEATDSASYQALFNDETDTRTDVINGFKYVRNVDHHLIHPVLPDPDNVVGGMGLGFRTFAYWADVPQLVHDQLRPSTQALRPFFEDQLRSRQVLDAMLDALRFFASVAPDLVHRSETGEWTGFPIRHQAAVRDRLHPDEPTEESDAAAWLNSRRPGGDFRVIVGAFSHDVPGQLHFGLSFRNSCGFTPFFESPDQIEDDLRMGHTYYFGDLTPYTERARLNDRFDLFETVMRTTTSDGRWPTEPLHCAPEFKEESVFQSVDSWRNQYFHESPPHPPWYLSRRARRLSAWYPVP